MIFDEKVSCVLPMCFYASVITQFVHSIRLLFVYDTLLRCLTYSYTLMYRCTINIIHLPSVLYFCMLFCLHGQGCRLDEMMYMLYNFEHFFLLNSKSSVSWTKDLSKFFFWPISKNLKSSFLKFVDPFKFTQSSEF